ncbi:MAG: DUF819 family protein [Phycisphaerae bacterium]|nr:DUF819 family protein [Phycisphaerae bacterium]
MTRVLCQSLFFLIAPALAGWACRRSRLLNAVSPIVLCYLVGIAMGNQRTVELNQAVSETLCEAAVMLAIPLLLFSVDLLGWFRLARPTLISCLLAFISVLVASACSALAFQGRIEDGPKIAGVLVGVYTGGTPNMAAISVGVGLSAERLAMVNTADVVLGGVYFLFLISIGYRLYGRFLPPTPRRDSPPDQDAVSQEPSRIPVKGAAVAFALAVVLAVASGAIAQWLPQNLRSMTAILLVTSLALVASMNRRIRTLAGTYEIAQYLLLLFAVAIGSMADLRKLAESSVMIVLYTGAIFFGSIVLHLALCACFRIDRDTAIVTHTAAIYSPAFVGPVVDVLKNREVMVSGIASGLVGFAVGTYAGLGVAAVLSSLLGS